MEVALGLVLAAFIFGAMLLMMVFGYQRIEQERSASANDHTAEQLLDGPRFFANVASAPRLATVPDVHPRVLERLEQRLRLEYQHAGMFASQPTLEGICPDYSAYVDALAREVEHHIQRECAATSAFVTEPTVERLCGDPGMPIRSLLRRHQAAQASAFTAHARRAV